VPSPEPDPFEHSFVAMIAARAVVTATSLGLFEALAERPDDASGLAERLGCDPLGAEALLAALHSLGYVEADGESYRLAPAASRLLVRSSPESLATFVAGQSALHWDVLSHLDEVLRTRRPYGVHEQGDPGLWEAYIRGLYELSRAEQDANAALVGVEEPRELLDVAGGHGGFAMAMCRRHPALHATILDLPASAAVGRRIVEEEGVADRIDFVEGDVFETELGEGLDVVSVFNLVHHLSPEQNVELLRRAREALAPGGAVVVGDSERPKPGETPSEVGALSGLLFYAMSRARTYTLEEIVGWFAEAGLPEPEVHRNERSPWRIVAVAR
jgi:SAM-dependent methyltransferase